MPNASAAAAASRCTEREADGDRNTGPDQTFGRVRPLWSEKQNCHTFLHPQGDLQLVLYRKALEVEGLARSDANARKLGADLLLVFLSGRKLQRKVEVFEEVRLRELFAIFGKSMVRAGGGAGCLK